MELMLTMIVIGLFIIGEKLGKIIKLLEDKPSTKQFTKSKR